MGASSFFFSPLQYNCPPPFACYATTMPAFFVYCPAWYAGSSLLAIPALVFVVPFSRSLREPSLCLSGFSFPRSPSSPFRGTWGPLFFFTMSIVPDSIRLPSLQGGLGWAFYIFRTPKFAYSKYSLYLCTRFGKNILLRF